MHRDIKPANIVLTKDGTLKVIDFGIALSLKPDQDIKTAWGTPNYMAPEQIGKTHYGSKVDIWAAGCVLYELFTRQLLINKIAAENLKKTYEKL